MKDPLFKARTHWCSPVTGPATGVWCGVAEGLWDIIRYCLCRYFSPGSRLYLIVIPVGCSACLISPHEGLILLVLPIKIFQVFKPAVHVANKSTLPVFISDICSHVLRKHLVSGHFWSLSIGNNKTASETLYKYQMVIQKWFMTGKTIIKAALERKQIVSTFWNVFSFYLKK